MKRTIYCVLLLVIHLIVHSQTDTIPALKKVQLDLLSTPANPAFSIMSASPAEIVEPNTASEFYLSIQNASNNFSSIPNNYGFSITPYWFTRAAKTLSFDEDFSTHQKAYFWRYLRLSAGVVKGSADNEKMWNYGLGAQTNILPGKVDKAKKEKYYNALRSYHNQYYKSFQEYLKYDPLFRELEAAQKNILKKISTSGGTDTSLISQYKKISNQKDYVQSLLSNQFEMQNKFEDDSIDVNAAFSDLEKRIGFKWDIAGGVACNVYDNLIDTINKVRAGFWTNFGWTLPVTKSGNYFDILGLARFLEIEDFHFTTEKAYFFVDKLFLIDMGVQVKYDYNNRFSFLLEAIYRIPFDNRLDNTYKINSQLQYKFNKNQLFFASFGNAFNEQFNEGPIAFQFNFGINLGIGQDVNIDFK
jgi:hypothetical protein